MSAMDNEMSRGFPGTRRPTDAEKAHVLMRLQFSAERVSRELHRAALLEWASRDEGEFPTLDSARREATHELQVLAAALGPWAAVQPEEVFHDLPGRAVPRPRRSWGDEG